mmetsp:Transcript_8063/g.33723  ORF Transcript_8063/g.33723 Transcript_8063/m.33723 type:complete len:217 (+) Transcript_8063:252-902(+)
MKRHSSRGFGRLPDASSDYFLRFAAAFPASPSRFLPSRAPGEARGAPRAGTYTASHSFARCASLAIAGDCEGTGAANGFFSTPTSSYPASRISSDSIASSISVRAVVTSGAGDLSAEATIDSTSASRIKSPAKIKYGERASFSATYDAYDASINDIAPYGVLVRLFCLDGVFTPSPTATISSPGAAGSLHPKPTSQGHQSAPSGAFAAAAAAPPRR